MTVAQGILPFKLIPDTEKSVVTSFSGLPLIVETMRALKLPDTIKDLLHIKKRGSGSYSETDYVESFISLFAAGGSRLDDFARMRCDKGLKELGFPFPSPGSARFFLYAFHDEQLLKERPGHGAFIPAETEALRNLLRIQERIIGKTHDHPTIATIDEDATVIESSKEEARPTYLGESGYQPVVNYWAEEDTILADEFRDGNVPAAYDLLSSLTVLRQRRLVEAHLHRLQHPLRHETEGPSHGLGNVPNEGPPVLPDRRCRPDHQDGQIAIPTILRNGLCMRDIPGSEEEARCTLKHGIDSPQDRPH
jgi:hypothetical protein